MASDRGKICIIGSGVVGQATGKGLLSKGFNVTFLDVSRSKVERLRDEGYLAYCPDELFDGRFDFDVSILSVSTPTVEGKINLEYLRKASEYLGKSLSAMDKYHLVVVKSTVLPGTTRNLVIKTIEKISGKSAGVNFGVCMNPEYLREKSASEDFINSWMITIGSFDGMCLPKDTEAFLSWIKQLGIEAPVLKAAIKINKMMKNRLSGSKVGLYKKRMDDVVTVVNYAH